MLTLANRLVGVSGVVPFEYVGYKKAADRPTGTTHTYSSVSTLNVGGTVQAGDVLIVQFGACDSQTTPYTWTNNNGNLTEFSNIVGDDTSNSHSIMYWSIAPSTPDTTWSWTRNGTTNSTPSTLTMLVFRGVQLDGGGSPISTNTTATGTNTARPNPAAVSASGTPTFDRYLYFCSGSFSDTQPGTYAPSTPSDIGEEFQSVQSSPTTVITGGACFGFSNTTTDPALISTGIDNLGQSAWAAQSIRILGNTPK